MVETSRAAPQTTAAVHVEIGLHVGQLQQAVPGGIGRYVRALLRELPTHNIEPLPFAAGARPRGAGANYTDLGWPRGSMRYEAWHRTRLPRLSAPGQIIHAPSLAVPPVSKRPLVVTAHDIAFHRFPAATTRRGRAFHERGLRLALEHADLVLAPSEFTRGELLDFGFPESRVQVAYLGADPIEPTDDAIIAEVTDRLEIRGPFVLTVGTIEPRKRLMHLAAAHRALREEFPDLELLIVGPNGWGDVGDLTGPGIRRLGALPWTYVDALYRSAAVCAIASVYEGFGLPAVEAMNRGCPVVAADGSAVAEVVGAAGIIVAQDDPLALANGIRSLLIGDALASHLSEAGIARGQDFTWSASAAQHAKIYRELV